jgi:myo-inositol-1(or 4)-monophosphatase
VTPDRLVKTARSVAQEAGRVLLDGYRSRPAATEKRRSDLVTEYDLRCEQLIRERLGRDTPGIPIVGEEQGGAPSQTSELTWYCDPLDGTMNFVHGHPFFCVSIGVMDAHGPLAGAVVAPALGVEWWGARGAGAFRNGEPCMVSTTDALRGSLLATGFPSDRSHTPGNNFGTFSAVIQHVQDIRRCGSAAIDCCFVADGTYEGYWERSLHAWDLAAGCAIALAAGGRLSSMTGGAADLTIGHIVLTNARIHDELLAAMRG